MSGTSIPFAESARVVLADVGLVRQGTAFRHSCKV